MLFSELFVTEGKLFIQKKCRCVIDIARCLVLLKVYTLVAMAVEVFSCFVAKTLRAHHVRYLELGDFTVNFPHCIGENLLQPNIMCICVSGQATDETFSCPD